MNDFDSHLTLLLDEAAAAIQPRADFDAVLAATVPVVSNRTPSRRRFRGALGAAAAAAALLGGGVAAYHVAGDDASGVVTSGDSVEIDATLATTPTTHAPRVADREPARPVVPVVVEQDRDAPTTSAPGDRHERTAELGALEVADGAIRQEIHGRAAPGELVTASSDFGSMTVEANDDAAWDLVLSFTPPQDRTAVHVRVTFGRADVVRELEIRLPHEPVEEPKTEEPKVEEPKVEEPKVEEPKVEEPKVEEPKPIAFTVHRADQYDDATHMKQVFYGTAPVGAVVYAQSDWGSTHVVAGPKGGWELHLVLADVPDDTVVRVVVSANTGGSKVFELVRAKPAPEPKAFTAQLGEGQLGKSPMKQVLYGTGTPGSKVLAATEYGSADAVVGPKGHWEMLLAMYEVPGGTTVGVRVTNSASDRVFEFALRRPADQPEPVDFTAHAAFETCDSEPPFNEYWGTSTAGATITISSPYGGGQVTSNAEGRWEARIEFPSAPVGQTFVVKVTSTKGSAVYEFPLTRL